MSFTRNKYDEVSYKEEVNRSTDPLYYRVNNCFSTNNEECYPYSGRQNHVNKKLNKPEFDFNLLDETYEKGNLILAINNLNIILNKNINVPKLMMATMHRKTISIFITQYFNNNIDKYIK